MSVQIMYLRLYHQKIYQFVLCRKTIYEQLLTKPNIDKKLYHKSKQD